MTTPNPYPGYYLASDGQYYPVQQQTPAAPPPPAAPAPAEPVAARGTLDDFDDQPSAGGGTATSKYFTPVRVQQGHWLQVQVSRDLNHNDVRQQKDKNNTLLTFKSTGKPKWECLVPTTLLSSSDEAGAAAALPDGTVTVFVKGLTRDALYAAMSAAGVANPGAAFKSGKLGGASFYMIAKGTKQVGNNTANVFEFVYTPNGRENEAADAVPPTTPATPPAPAVSAEPTASAPPAPPAAAAPPPPAPSAPPAAAPTASAPAAPPPPPATPTAPAPPAAVTPPPAPASAPPTAAGSPPPPPPAGVPAPPVDAKKAALLQQLQGQSQ